jgi:hypothetical protein
VTSKLVAACLAVAGLSACTIYNPPPIAPAAVAVHPGPAPVGVPQTAYAYPAYPGYPAYPAYPVYPAYPGYAYPAVGSLSLGFGFGGGRHHW